MSGYNTNLAESENVVLDGIATQLYVLWLHVQGAVELMAYEGGEYDDRFQIGGSPKNYPNTVVKLTVSNPARTYYLNRSASLPTNFAMPINYWAPIEAYGGATLTLSLERGDHTLYYEDQGGGTVKTELNDFAGEYIQLDFATTLEADVVEKRAGAGSCRNWIFSGYEENVLGTKAEK